MTTSHASRETTSTIPNAPAKDTHGKEADGKTAPSSSIASRLSSLADPAAPDVDPLPTLFELPIASRARMRLCGERWHRMKLNGEARDEIWRDFATTCLVAKVESSDTALDSARPKEADMKSGPGPNKSR